MKASSSPGPERVLLSLRQRGVIALPPAWRTAELFEAFRRADGVIELHPRTVVNPDQAWFWTERWQKMEREAQEDIDSGRVVAYDSADAMLADLARTRKRKQR